MVTGQEPDSQGPNAPSDASLVPGHMTPILCFFHVHQSKQKKKHYAFWLEMQWVRQDPEV